jgi:hypothetical protein
MKAKWPVPLLVFLLVIWTSQKIRDISREFTITAMNMPGTVAFQIHHVAERFHIKNVMKAYRNALCGLCSDMFS